MAKHPALEVRFLPGPGAGALQDLLYAELDEFEPTAIEDHETVWRVFFATSSRRDDCGAALRSALGGHVVDLARIDVDDEDWARRSQANLTAVRVGRIVVAPPWDVPGSDRPASDLIIVITPSMGFGTGHHATTRLCLELLQEASLDGRAVVDVGTGSGVLAIAAAKLGAARVTAIDNDPDAIQNARENSLANAVDASIDLRVADLRHVDLAADLLVANLTAAALTTHARALQACLAPSGHAILSGFSPADADLIASAWPTFEVRTRKTQDDWAALALVPAGSNL